MKVSFWCFKCGKHDSVMDENQKRCPFCGVLLRVDAKTERKKKGLNFYKNEKN